MANASDKSKVILIDPKAKTEEFKRPDHPDFMTSSELGKAEFTGVRENNITQQYEFWISGSVVKRVSYMEASMDRDALSKAHAEVFKM